MSDRVLTGTRVRNRRLDLGLRQAYVAQQVGISASYLNLIEHNRRRIGASLLAQLAEVLNVEAAALEDAAAAAVVAPLQEAAAAFPSISMEDMRAEDLIARFPGWAALITAQQSRITKLEARTQALTNRLAHDTQIATSLHEVISTATAIRSTASILNDSPELDADWRDRFHANIDTDSARLAQSSQALLGFLDMELDVAGDLEESPLEQAEAIMVQRKFQIAPDEKDAFDDVSDTATRAILTDWAKFVEQDATVLPTDDVLQAARALAFDPARIAARFHVPLDQVMRRLAHLPETPDMPLMGLAMCDAAGVVTFQKPILDFRLPRAAAACPLWPLYQSMAQPGRALRRIVRLPGAARTPFECFAIATPQGELTFGEEPRIAATMLVRVARTNDSPGTVGPGCRICSVEQCESRRHPSVV